VLPGADSEGNTYGRKYDTIPDTDWKRRKGYTVPQGKIMYEQDGGKMKHDWPAFLQADSYTGVIALRWAYSPNMIEKKEIYFFVYKRGK
jgi:hypothetical protein